MSPNQLNHQIIDGYCLPDLSAPGSFSGAEKIAEEMFGPCRNYQKLILHLQDDCCHCLGIQAIDLGERSRLFKGFKGFKAP